MRIKSYQCKRFAGLKDINVEFEDGINVILGPNESGKSTIINGIHSTLFKDTKLRNNNNADKDFSFKFMPKPSGDFIDGRVVVELENGQFEVYKEWGSNENIYLVDLNGSIIKNKNDIKEEIGKLLNYGESTYSNIVFAKQRDLKMAIGNIIRNSEITSEINDLLRQTMMELDGISIDKIEKNIEAEIDDLYKRWDMDKNYPEKNRGINNPYKTGLGEILKNYYNKEQLKLLMEKADKSEKEFENICNEIKELKDKRELLIKEKSELEKIEDDVNSRAILEAEINRIDNVLEDLTRANREWPMTEELIKQKDENIKELKAKREDLNEEKKNIEKAKKRDSIQKRLKRIEEIEVQIQDIEEEISKIPEITKDDIDKLKNLQKELLTLETTMRASKMIGILKKSGDNPVYVSKDFGENEVLESNTRFEANGLININYNDEFEVEIKTGDIDFEELNNKYKSAKKEYDEIINSLNIDSVEAGMINFETIRSKKGEEKSLDRELNLVLGDSTKEELENRLKELENIKISRDLDEIEIELQKTSEEEVELTSDKKTKEHQIKLWQDKYKDHDNLFELVVEEKSKLKDKREKLENLKPLPERFITVEEFKSRLRWLKDENDTLDDRLRVLSGEQYEAKSNLLDDTYEELKKEYLDAQKTFEKKIKRGEKLLEIKRVFLETKENLSNNPMEPLVDEFARLLSIITDGSYKSGDIDEEFNIKLENRNGEIPVELLSAGTYDSVALALRFSLLKHIFKDKGGYVVLDDCLVDLDPERKIQSIKLINNLSKDYQIIFTTCDPETAKMLGGNIIKLKG